MELLLEIYVAEHGHFQPLHKLTIGFPEIVDHLVLLSFQSFDLGNQIIKAIHQKANVALHLYGLDGLRTVLLVNLVCKLLKIGESFACVFGVVLVCLLFTMRLTRCCELPCLAEGF